THMARHSFPTRRSADLDLNEILSRLEGVHGSGKQYSARCQAHDDKRASLSVSVGEDGKVLFNCHDGCTAQEITRALGLSMEVLRSEEHTSELQSRFDLE